MLAEIDPDPYRDQVELAQSKLDAAEAELRRQEAGLDRLKLEVPIQIEIAHARWPQPGGPGQAEKALELTHDGVERDVDEAQAGLEAAKADLVLAEQEFTRSPTCSKKMRSPCGGRRR